MIFAVQSLKGLGEISGFKVSIAIRDNPKHGWQSTFDRTDVLI